MIDNSKKSLHNTPWETKYALSRAAEGIGPAKPGNLSNAIYASDKVLNPTESDSER